MALEDSRVVGVYTLSARQIWSQVIAVMLLLSVTVKCSCVRLVWRDFLAQLRAQEFCLIRALGYLA